MLDPDGVGIFFLNLALCACHSFESVVCFSLYSSHALPNHSRAAAKHGLILW